MAAVNVAGFPPMMAPGPPGQPGVPPPPAVATSLLGAVSSAPLLQQHHHQQQQQMLPQHFHQQMHSHHQQQHQQHLHAHFQAAPMPLANMNGRVSFHDTRMEVRIASLACLSDELRRDIWYSPSDIDGMRTEVRDLCRFLRVNPQACPEEHTRGLELRISLERQCRKQLTVQGVVEAQRRCTDPAYIACLAQRCSIVPRDLALAQGQRDYSTVYAAAALLEGTGAASLLAPEEASGCLASGSAPVSDQAPPASASTAPTANPLDNSGMEPCSNNKNMRGEQNCGGNSDGITRSYPNDMINNQYMFNTCSPGQPGMPFQFQPAHHHQQQQHQHLSFQPHCYSGPQYQHQHYSHQQRQQTPFSDIDESDALFDPIMMEPIPFAASLPPTHGNQHQQQHQQQQHQLQSLGEFFDDGNGKRSYDNMFVTTTPAATASSTALPSATTTSSSTPSVEDPQDRTVRRRLEGMSSNLNI